MLSIIQQGGNLNVGKVTLTLFIASRAAVARAAGTGRRHPRRPERRTVARKPEGPRSHAHERRDGRYLGVGPRNTNCRPAAQSGLGPCMSIWGITLSTIQATAYE